MVRDKLAISESKKPLPPDVNGYCYLDEEHYKSSIEKIAKRLISKHGSLMDRTLHFGILFINTTIIVMLIAMIFIRNRLPFFALLLLFSILSSWHTYRIKCFSKSIIKHNMCIKCAYSLTNSPTNEDGYGNCSECGEQFNVGYYRQLPHNYKRSLLGVIPTHWTDSVHPLDRAHMQIDKSQATDN